MVTACVVALCCTLLVLFYEALNHQMSVERSNHLNQISEKIGENFNIMLEEQWHLMESSARMFLSETYENEEQLIAKAGETETLLGCEKESIWLIDSEGFCYRSSGTRVRWENPDCLSAELPEEQVLITDLSLFEKSEEQILFLYRLPQVFRTKDDVVKITHLALVRDMTAFGRSMSLHAGLDKSSSSFIVHQNGTVVYYQANRSDFGDAYNILNLLKNAEFLYGSNYEQMCTDMNEGKSGTVEVIFEGQNWFVSYCNAKVNNWYILQMIPDNITNGYSGSYAAMALVYIVGIALLLCALIIYNVVVTTREKLRQEKEAKAAIQRLADEARQANQAKTDFLSNMSHDIRTPINGIIGMTAIAKRNITDAAKLKECLDKISVASNHLLSLINDILDMSRIEKGKTVIAHNPFNLRTLLDDCSTLISNQLEDQNVEFVRDYEDLEHVHLLGDEVHIRQVLINILGNSVKFTPDGGKISLSVKQMENRNGNVIVQFICSDTGIGMSKEFQKRIFLPFEQEEGGARSSHKGTGLGMPIAYNLMRMMGGRMKLQSELDKGTTFTLYLDFDIDMNAEQIQEEEKKWELKGMKVLLTEDNAINREIVEEILGEEGILVTSVTDGQEAVDTFRDAVPGTFDVILMDVMMPVMNGLEAAKTIRALRREDAKTIPILAMTANAYEEDVRKTKEAGMDEHLSKPLDVSLMMETLMKYRSGTNKKE